MTTLGKTGEVDLIRKIAALLGPRHDVVHGCGDDCAVVSTGPRATEDWLLTSDSVIEGIHFETGTRPDLVGRKAVGRVLSDIAAMGGQPLWSLVDLVAPSATDTDLVMELYRGMIALADEMNMAIVGGDTARGHCLALHVFGVGSVPRGRSVLRSGARPGDALFVTGALGGSRAGRHLDFVPRIQEGMFLRDWASGMIDVSDGLATDLRHIASQSAVGADLDTTRIPVSEAALAMKGDQSPLQHALNDGEDFELLFTVPSRKRDAFLTRWPKQFKTPLAEIGVITDKTGRLLLKFKDGRLEPMAPGGHDHFA